MYAIRRCVIPFVFFVIVSPPIKYKDSEYFLNYIISDVKIKGNAYL